MKLYKLKHLPTGLYYVPSRDKRLKLGGEYNTPHTYIKSNLSEKGKIYSFRQPPKPYGIYNHLLAEELVKKGLWDVKQGYLRNSLYQNCKEEDWEIIEMNFDE